MRRILLCALLAGTLAACTTAQMQQAAQTPAGQLFCAFQMAGGGTVIGGIVNGAAAGANAGLGAVAVVATGATAAFVNDQCAQAARGLTGAVSATPVPPPANPAAVPQVAVPASK